MTTFNISPGAQGEAAREILEEMGYERIQSLNPEDGNRFEKYDRGVSVNCMLTYSDEEELQKIEVNIPPGEPGYRGTGTHELDSAEVKQALDYIQNEEKTDFRHPDERGGFIQSTLEPQSSPEETADTLEETVETAENLADIKAALG